MQVLATTPIFSRRQVYVAIYAATVAFLAYTSVYAYRKPFTVASFAGIQFAGVSYQTLLIISQVIGYMLSKFYGIKFIAELKRLDRWKTTAVLVGTAWLCLLIFAFVPPPYGVFCFLVNGFVLGFMWGIVFSYVEGRRATDFIGSVMAISFIFAGGFTRSVAKWLMESWGVTEQWMPFMTGLVFLPPLILFTWLLEQIPQPDEEDILERTVRVPMNKRERKKLLKSFSWGIAVITITYLFLTIMRDIRDNYMANIWDELGYGNQSSVFATTETVTSLVVLAIMCMLVFIRRNEKAFRIVHLVILTGFLIAGISSGLFITGIMSGALWMQLVGLGLYLAYIPFNCIFFERMIATFRIAGNVGFLIYFADAFGYLGSVTVMLSKELLNLQVQWSSFYSHGVIVFSLIGAAGTILSLAYFTLKKRRQRQLYG